MTAARAALAATGAPRRLDFIDTVLVVIFLLGLYLGVSLAVSSKVPRGYPTTCSDKQALIGFLGDSLFKSRRAGTNQPTPRKEATDGTDNYLRYVEVP